ncbi:bifunctional lysylphosphatidylglycerol flippase/synthetase MprF [Rhodococcus aetherivorans]|uniref:bifunctional lysylphosphatidylglycerol flippase/synthetase MprF n=1 Tax=Rhodococcus aetherivorans TaxID=191292 RepID=UPI00369720D6
MTTLHPTVSPAGTTTRWAALGLYLVAVVAFGISAYRSSSDPAWAFALALAIGLIARGMRLHRPVVPAHLTVSITSLLVARLAYADGHPHIGFALIAVSGLALVRPVGSVPQPDEHTRIFALVQQSTDDPLAPFTLNSAKSYFYNAAGTAAIAYRARAGIAVVSGDPVGHGDAFEDLLTQFVAFATSRGWRVAVLAASEHTTRLWRAGAGGRAPLRAVGIGCDVVVDVTRFSLRGREFRNLRQAVQRSRNAGVSTEIIAERDLPATVRRDLIGITSEARTGHQRRGFSMILDHLLDGMHPGMMVVVARDRHGHPVGFQRYGTAHHGREWSLDVPWRSTRAPNGTDERMIVDVIDHVGRGGGTSVSLAFAPFPQLFSPTGSGTRRRALRRVLRLGSAVIALESLYRYLDKFHAPAGQRFALFGISYVLPAVFAMLTFEFVPHREHSPHRRGPCHRDREC